MKKTFYGIVTQYDCDPRKVAADDPPRGPLLLERYLNVPDAESESATRALAERWHGGMGWSRVATITVDLPEEPVE